MSGALGRAWRGVRANAAATDPDSDDPRLRGRTYAVPFEVVWQAALRLAGGELKRWRVASEDDVRGVIRGECRTLFGSAADVLIRVRLDQNAQTRVDLRSASRERRFDLGANARAIGRFLDGLDRTLGRAGRGSR